MVKSGPIFGQAAKLGKASRNAYNPGLWLIFYDLLKNWVAEGVATEVNVFKCSYKNWFEKIKVFKRISRTHWSSHGLLNEDVYGVAQGQK